MPDLKYRQKKIQEKRKKTPRREFVKEMASVRGLTLYKNQGNISRYPISERHGKLVSLAEYNEYAGDFLDYGIDVRVNDKSFFSQFQELFKSVPKGYLLDYGGNENAAYADLCYNSKNCYLSNIVINGCEDICYSYNVKDNSQNVFSSMMVWNQSTNVYLSMGVLNSYNIFYSRYILDSSDIWFSDNLL